MDHEATHGVVFPVGQLDTEIFVEVVDAGQGAHRVAGIVEPLDLFRLQRVVLVVDIADDLL